MLITSPSFDDGAAIPYKFTCDGGDINPELQIQNIPPEAKSLALIMHDPDAPMKGGFRHWNIWNIDPRAQIIKEESTPPDAIEGRNGAGKFGYVGPCPPSGTHHYEFRLYALDDILDLPPEANAEELQNEIQKHSIAEAKLTGTYSRTK